MIQSFVLDSWLIAEDRGQVGQVEVGLCGQVGTGGGGTTSDLTSLGPHFGNSEVY